MKVYYDRKMLLVILWKRTLQYLIYPDVQVAVSTQQWHAGSETLLRLNPVFQLGMPAYKVGPYNGHSGCLSCLDSVYLKLCKLVSMSSHV